jgi:hypothetical protein
MFLPRPRGPISAALVDALHGAGWPGKSVDPVTDPLADDDLQLALWIGFELHYRGFEDVAESWEWDPQLIGLRRELEAMVLDQLRREVVVLQSDRPVAVRLGELIDSDDGPPLSRYLQRRASRSQFNEFVVHRSVYQLKEADPHTWVIPRLGGRAKAALIEIQIDEYAHGDPKRMHQELYRTMLRGLGLNDAYGFYVDAVPGITLAVSNVMSLFALRRELRGALAGHLAAYEMTSSEPCRRYARGLRRLRADGATCEFFDEHVTADALHEQLASHDLCGGLAEAEPELTDDILFGAAACLHVDGRFGRHLLAHWEAGQSSLYGAGPLAAPSGRRTLVSANA